MEKLDLAAIKSAQKAIQGIAIETPLIPSAHLSDVTASDVYLKLESMQPVGAFKLRGAANALANLPNSARGVACCSTGNHGRAIAYAARKLGLRAVVCMTDKVPQTKVDGIRSLGGEIRLVAGSQDDAQAEVARLVAGDGLVDISPFDNQMVIAGQGTIALEMLAQQPDIQTIVVPLSGGGLASGIALAAKSIRPDIRVVGVTMDQGAAMYLSIRAGHPVDVDEVGSLADSLSGGIFDDNQHTLRLCDKLLDDTVLVTEAEIYHAMQHLYFNERLIAEGGASVGIAALLAGRIDHLKGPVAAVITGRNVDMAMFSDIISGRPVTLGTTKITGKPFQ